MRHLISFALCLSAFTGCKKKADSIPLGTTGLSFDETGLVDRLLVKEQSPGLWDVTAPGNGLTTVAVKNDGGMPTREHLDRSQHEDLVVGNAGRISDGPNGMLIYELTMTKGCATGCSPEQPQYFLTAYIPTADGAARCEGFSKASAADEHLTVCKKLVSSTKPSAAAAADPAGTAAPMAPTAPAPPAPPKP